MVDGSKNFKRQAYRSSTYAHTNLQVVRTEKELDYSRSTRNKAKLIISFVNDKNASLHQCMPSDNYKIVFAKQIVLL